MRLVMIAVALALLTAPAYSQMGGMGGRGMGGGDRGGPEKPKEDTAKKAKEEREFKDAVKRIPVPEKKYDPWGTVRDAGSSR